jgi:predicted dehydrogenase
MLEEEKVDVVDICTPPQTHATLVTQAMEAGHHVLVEKPLALNLSDADRMAEVAKSKGVRLCVVHNELFLPVVMKAKSLVDEGTIGDLVGLNITSSMPRDKDLILNREHWCHKLPGGIFGEMLPHPIYLAAAFLDALEPVSVHSQKLSQYGWVVADELRVVLKGKNGLATIIASVNWSKGAMALDIFGTKASLHVDIWGGVMTGYSTAARDRLSRATDNLARGFQWLAGTASTTLSVVLGRYHSGHYTLIKGFIESLQNDTQPPVTIEEARETVRLYEAITSQI